MPAAAGDPAGEIILVGASEMQQDPFSDIPLAKEVKADFVKPQAVESTVKTGTGGAVAATSGGEPGLYGGSMNESYCDVAQLIDFLGKNADKAAGWVKAVTSDPSAKLMDGRTLTVDLIPTYINSLTAVVLTEDTRVTNHGFVNGEPDPWQSVLQKGTSVLVDMNGVPRTQCWCGNPLAPAIPVTGTPNYTGKVWGDFDPAKVTAVDPSPEIIIVFVIAPTNGGDLFTRPAGTNGTFDAQPPAGTPATTQTASGIEKAQHPDFSFSMVIPAGQTVEYTHDSAGIPWTKVNYSSGTEDTTTYITGGGTGFSIRDHGTDQATASADQENQKKRRQGTGYSDASRATTPVVESVTLGVLTGESATFTPCAADPSNTVAPWGDGDTYAYYYMVGPNGEQIRGVGFNSGITGLIAALSSVTF